MSKLMAAHSKTFDVYDFDKTIYDGDCSLDFYWFCLRREPSIIRYFPLQVWHLFLLLLAIEDRTAFKAHFFVFLRGISDTAEAVTAFWAGHYREIKEWYRSADHTQDIIISASPEFLLRPAAEKLQTVALIGTRMDPTTGHIDGRNCRGDEKVSRLRAAMGNVDIRKVYTDSKSDGPLLTLAKEGYLVKGDRIVAVKGQD